MSRPTAWVDIDCHDCLGLGHVTELCSACGGAGVGQWPDEPHCMTCEGTGTVILGDCLRCEGAGWWSIPAHPGSAEGQR